MNDTTVKSQDVWEALAAAQDNNRRLEKVLNELLKFCDVSSAREPDWERAVHNARIELRKR